MAFKIVLAGTAIFGYGFRTFVALIAKNQNEGVIAWIANRWQLILIAICLLTILMVGFALAVTGVMRWIHRLGTLKGLALPPSPFNMSQDHRRMLPRDVVQLLYIAGVLQVTVGAGMFVVRMYQSEESTVIASIAVAGGIWTCVVTWLVRQFVPTRFTDFGSCETDDSAGRAKS